MTKDKLKFKYTGADRFLQGFDYFIMDDMEFFFGVYENEEPKRVVFIVNYLQEEIRDNHEPY